MLTLNWEDDDIVQDDGDGNGNRVYHISSRKLHYPSCTSVISHVEPKDGLIKWQENVGKDKAEFIRNSSAVRGSAVHKQIENQLQNELVEFKTEEVKSLFDKIAGFLPYLKSVFIEKRLYWCHPDNEQIGFAGTPDLISMVKPVLYHKDKTPLFVNDALCILDWKTKDKYKRPSATTREGIRYFPFIKYYLQLAAYSAAINQRTNHELKLNKALLVQLTHDSKEPVIYYLNPEEMCFYWKQFKLILDCYFNKTTFDWKQLELEAYNNNYCGERVWFKV